MRKTKYRKHGKPLASLRCSATDLILVAEGLQCANCCVLVVEHINGDGDDNGETAIAD